MQIVDIEISKLKSYENNARYHTDDQLEQIENSIKEFGFVNPVLIDENNVIIAGHGRKLAAVGVGLDTLPCIVLEGLDENQKKALRIADNRLPQNASWDIDLLITEIGELYNDGYNVDRLGFSEEDINKLLEHVPVPEAEGSPEAEPGPGQPAGENQGTPEGGEGEPAPAPSPDVDPGASLAGLEEKIIKIRVPAKYEDQILEYLAGDELKTPGGLGRGILKRLELI